jgi:hypothetical protein
MTDDAPRLTPTQRLHEVTMAAMSRTPSAPEHSVTISRNARGIVQCEVTVRGYDLDDVMLGAAGAFATLDTRYPYPVNGASE